MQNEIRQNLRRQVTLLEVIATVNALTKDEEEAAVVINHMFASERIAFANGPVQQEEIARLLQ